MKSQTLSFGLCGKGCLFIRMNTLLPFNNVRLMTASRPFARYAQPNNLAGRLSIFSG